MIRFIEPLAVLPLLAPVVADDDPIPPTPLSPCDCVSFYYPGDYDLHTQTGVEIGETVTVAGKWTIYAELQFEPIHDGYCQDFAYECLGDDAECEAHFAGFIDHYWVGPGSGPPAGEPEPSYAAILKIDGVIESRAWGGDLEISTDQTLDCGDVMELEASIVMGSIPYILLEGESYCINCEAATGQ